jgi:hypothetical protein
MKNFIFLFVIFSLSQNILFSQNPSLIASISKNPVSEGERFQVTFTLNAEGQNFKPPDFKGFSVIMGPSQSTSMQIINGKVSQSVSFTYILEAGNMGKYTIGSASIVSNGQKIVSNTIDVTVVKGAAPHQSQQQKSEDQQAQEIIEPNLYITLSVSKSSVYLGEQVIATYKLFKHPELQLVKIDLPKMPAFNGFWAQDIEDIKQLDYSSEMINGVRFQTAILKKVILLPQQSGNLTVDPIELNTTVRLRVQQKQRSRGFFDDFFSDPFFGSYKDFNYSLRSRTAKLSVKALPDNAPVDFKGAVGEMQLKGWLDRTKTKTNEPVALKIQLSGKGNLKLVEPFSLNLPTDIESYEPKVADNLTLSASGYSGNKIFEYLLIPRHAGKFEIEPVIFSYFDLGRHKYVTLTTDKFILDVEKGEGSESQIVSGVAKEEIQYLGKDIRFIKDPPTSFKQRGSRFYLSTLFFIFGTAPLFLFIAFIIIRKKQIKLNSNQLLLRNRQANKVAKKHLSLAKSYLTNSEKDKFYEELTRALWGYLSDKLSIPLAELTKDTAASVLEKLNVPQESTQKYLSVINDCEFARFAPVEQFDSLDISYKVAEKVIIEMEGNLR